LAQTCKGNPEKREPIDPALCWGPHKPEAPAKDVAASFTEASSVRELLALSTADSGTLSREPSRSFSPSGFQPPPAAGQRWLNQQLGNDRSGLRFALASRVLVFQPRLRGFSVFGFSIGASMAKAK
jgi:hypothetical protein